MANKFKAQEEYASRMKKDGMARTTVWVPANCLEEIKDCAELMRQREWVELSPAERPQTRRRAS